MEFAAAEQPEAYQAEKAEETVDVTLGENEYAGSAIDMAPLTLKIKLENEKITAIEMIAETETKALGDIAIEKMIDRILEAQSTDVDTVSGATLTSNAIIVAAEQALENKALEEAK